MMDRRPTLAVCLLASLLLGSNCETEEILGPVVVEASGDGGESALIVMPYVGRLTMDYAIDNRGDSERTIDILVEASQNDNPFGDRCDDFNNDSVRYFATDRADTDVPAFNTGLPRVNITEEVVELALVPFGDRFAGWFRLNGVRGRVHLSMAPSSTTARVVDENGNALPPIAQEAGRCDGERVTEFVSDELRIDEEAYRIRVESAEPSVLLTVSETCASRAVVDRACPGFRGEVARQSLGVPARGSRSGRFRSTELGVGNAIGVTVRCEGAPCNAVATFTPYIENLECERDDDCSASRFCSTEGYCLRESDGCSMTRRGPASMAALLALVALVAGVRRARTGQSDSPPTAP